MNDKYLEEFNWYSLSWFSPSTLTNFHWEYSFILYLLPLVPFIFVIRWLLHFRFRQKLDIAFPPEELRKSFMDGLLRFVPSIIFTIFISLILLALARPQKTSEKIESHSLGIDILFALDISESMLLEDLSPNRLEAAKKILLEFIKKRTEDRIGIVVFTGAAFTLVPLTTDEQLLNESLKRISTNMIDTGSTSIGNAIAVSINRLQEASSTTKVLILLTDGENTAGNISPEMAAKLAYVYNIKIYCIGVGRQGSVPYGKDQKGKTMFVTSSINEGALKKIAQIGKGHYYKANDEKALIEIFKKIDFYEKGKIKEIRFKDSKDYYRIYLFWGLLFYILWILSKSTFLSNALED